MQYSLCPRSRTFCGSGDSCMQFYRRAAPYSFALLQTSRDRAHHHAQGAGLICAGLANAVHRYRQSCKMGSSAPQVWWSATPGRMRARPRIHRSGFGNDWEVSEGDERARMLPRDAEIRNTDLVITGHQHTDFAQREIAPRTGDGPHILPRAVGRFQPCVHRVWLQ